MKRQEERENAAKMKYPYAGGAKGDICQASIPIFIEGAKWADDTMIERACEWLKQDMIDSLAFQGRLGRFDIIDGIIERFRKAMEE